MQTIFIDFETYWDSKINLSKMNYSEYIAKTTVMLCTVLINNKLITWSENEIERELQKINWANTCLIGHNLLFDAGILAFKYNIRAAQYIDTIGLSRLQQFEKNSLEWLSTNLLKTTIKDKSILLSTKGRHWNQLTKTEQQAMILYNQQDILITKQLYELLKTNNEQQLALMDVLLKIWVNPILEIDIEGAHKYLAEEKLKIELALAELNIDKATIRSDKKFREYLTQLGLDCENLSFAKDNEEFMELKLTTTNTRIRRLLELKTIINSNIKEKRTERIITTAQIHHGKLPVCYNFCGAHTGRLSGGNKINLQNLPKKGELRNIIQAPQGYVLVAGDSSQIEARLLAWLANEKDILQEFKDEKDPYCEMATKIFNHLVTKKDEEKRFVGKSAVLGLGYGMGPKKFQAYCANNEQKFYLEFCEQIVNKFRSIREKTTQFWKFCDAQLKTAMLTGQETEGFHTQFRKEQITLPSERTINYHNLHCTNGIFKYGVEKPPAFFTSEAINETTTSGYKIYGPMLAQHITQAIATDVITWQLLEINRLFQVVLLTHDEIVILVKENEVKIAADKLLGIMKTSPTWCSNVPLAAKVGYHKVYGKIQK